MKDSTEKREVRQMDLFEKKHPVEVPKGYVALWECMEDCFAARGTILSFIRGKTYRQLKSTELALETERGAMCWLSKWESRFRFHSIQPWQANEKRSLI